MMIEAYNLYDGQALGSEKVRECSGEGGEKIGDIQAPPKTFHKNAYAPKPNPLKNKLDTTTDPPIFPHSTNDFQKPIKFKSDLGHEFIGKSSEKPSEEKPSEQPQPKEKPNPYDFIVTLMGEMITRVSFSSRGSMRREWQRSGLTRTSTTFPMVSLSLECRCLGPRQL
jgi:hypothetical protein